MADVLIGDEQAVYNPRDYNDKLLLGLKGTMSEAEQYWMRLRLQGGRQSKARRGELYLRPPNGYQWDASEHRLRLDPDEHIQQAVRLVFERFRVDGSANAVTRYFAQHELTIPVRDASTGEVRDVPPYAALILATLRNPIYTGAYVFGRREHGKALVDGKLRRRHVQPLPIEEWKTCLKNLHPQYISWEEFMSNQQKHGDLLLALVAHEQAAQRLGVELDMCREALGDAQPDVVRGQDERMVQREGCVDGREEPVSGGLDQVSAIARGSLEQPVRSGVE